MKFLSKAKKVFSALLVSIVAFSVGNACVFAESRPVASVYLLKKDTDPAKLPPPDYVICADRGIFTVKKPNPRAARYDDCYKIHRASKVCRNTMDVVRCGGTLEERVIPDETVYRIKYGEGLYNLVDPVKRDLVLFSMNNVMTTGNTPIMAPICKIFPDLGTKIKKEPGKMTFSILDEENQPMRIVKMDNIMETNIVNVILLLSATVLR